VFEAPISFLWKPAIAATEWGHALALFAAPVLLLAIPGRRLVVGKVGAALALVALVLLLSPLARALPVASDLPGRLTKAFGAAPPRELPGAPARPSPLVMAELLAGPPSVEVSVTRHVYRTVDAQQLPLDLYLRPDAPRPCPILVAIHGGSWSSGGPGQLPAINRYLAARGYAVAAIGYRLAPRHRFPAAHDDVLAAIAWLKDEGAALGLDPERIALLGRSAGGHLALLAAYASDDDAICGVVAYYPPTDMVWSWEHPSNPLVFDSPGVLSAFLGGTPTEQPRAYEDASPLRFVGRGAPPTLLIHGARDELVFQRQSERLAARLDEVGAPKLLLALPWATHGCDANPAGPSGQLGTYAIERFLAAVLLRK
jgi:acetyl esterase/lipase